MRWCAFTAVLSDALLHHLLSSDKPADGLYNTLVAGHSSGSP